MWTIDKKLPLFDMAKKIIDMVRNNKIMSDSMRDLMIDALL